MKSLISIFLFLTAIFGCQNTVYEHPNNEVPKEQNYMASVDSVIYRHEYGLVYLTKDTNAIMYDWLTLKKIDTLSLLRLYNEIRSDSTIEMNHFKELNIQQNWSPLEIYKGKFYVYSPSDWMSSAIILITDSIIYNLATDYTYYKIESILKNSPSKIILKLNRDFSSYSTFLEISYIDKQKGIALWEFKDEDDNLVNRELRVVSKNVRNFDMIVNDCLGRKCVNSFAFDPKEIDKLRQKKE